VNFLQNLMYEISIKDCNCGKILLDFQEAVIMTKAFIKWTKIYSKSV
jgi:hypothetical protein